MRTRAPAALAASLLATALLLVPGSAAGQEATPTSTTTAPPPSSSTGGTSDPGVVTAEELRARILAGVDGEDGADGADGADTLQGEDTTTADPTAATGALSAPAQAVADRIAALTDCTLYEQDVQSVIDDANALDTDPEAADTLETDKPAIQALLNAKYAELEYCDIVVPLADDGSLVIGDQVSVVPEGSAETGGA